MLNQKVIDKELSQNGIELKQNIKGIFTSKFIVEKSDIIKIIYKDRTDIDGETQHNVITKVLNDLEEIGYVNELENDFWQMRNVPEDILISIKEKIDEILKEVDRIKATDIFNDSRIVSIINRALMAGIIKNVSDVHTAIIVMLQNMSKKGDVNIDIDITCKRQGNTGDNEQGSNKQVDLSPLYGSNFNNDINYISSFIFDDYKKKDIFSITPTEIVQTLKNKKWEKSSNKLYEDVNKKIGIVTESTMHKIKGDTQMQPEDYIFICETITGEEADFIGINFALRNKGMIESVINDIENNSEKNKLFNGELKPLYDKLKELKENIDIYK